MTIETHVNRSFQPTQPMIALLRTVSATPAIHLFNLHPRSLISQAENAKWISKDGDGWVITESGIVALELRELLRAATNTKER